MLWHLTFVTTGVMLMAVARLLHEWTHAMTAMAIGCEVHQIDVYHGKVTYTHAHPWQEVAVRHAPFVLGLLSLPAVLVVASGLWLAPALLAWLIYACWGGAGEIGPVAVWQRVPSFN
jgi:hypothetical protein